MVRRMITSSSNAQIKNIIALQKKSKARNEQDVFVVEAKEEAKKSKEVLNKRVFVPAQHVEEE